MSEAGTNGPAPEPDADEWAAMAAWLAEPSHHGARDGRRIDTHTAMIALVGERAWKLRRPVDYGWLDYGTRARRLQCAELEISLNGPTAPGLYIGLGGIAPDGDGFRLIEPGGSLPETAEACVVMERFGGDQLFDRKASEQRLTPSLIHAAGRAVAEMHKTRPQLAKVMPYHELIENEIAELTAMTDIFRPDMVETYAEALRTKRDRRADVLAGRTVRRCHGDLHLGNIVMWNGEPTPFDCIEFNDDFSVIDPLYDIAFLLMDLEHRGIFRLASIAYNAWAERMAAEPGRDVHTAYGGAGLLPLCKAIRAGVRAKVGGLAARHWEGASRENAIRAARAYLAEAAQYVIPRPEPRLIAVGGLSGSGKSSMARGLAPPLDAIVLRSDAIRKGLRGVNEITRLSPDAYTREASQHVYSEMLLRAEMALESGANVILDAAHLDPEERARAARLASDMGLRFTGLWLEAPVEWLKERVEKRKNDVSDADASVVEWQTGYDLGEIDWHRIPANRSRQEVLKIARGCLADT